MAKSKKRALQGKKPSHALASVVGASVVLALAAGCAQGVPQTVQVAPNEYLGVCVDPNTGQRVPDFDCGGGLGPTGLALDPAGYYWDYFPSSYVGGIPRVGVIMPHTHVIVRTVPRTVVVSRSVPSTGGSASSLRTRLATSARSATGAKVKTPAAGTAPKQRTKPGVKTNSKSPVQRGGFGVPVGRVGGTSHPIGGGS